MKTLITLLFCIIGFACYATTNVVTITEGTQTLLLTNHTTIKIQSSASPKPFQLKVNSARDAKASPLYLKLPNMRTARIWTGDVVIYTLTPEAGEWVAERITE